MPTISFEQVHDEKKENVRFGIICPSEIALRRFMPALMDINGGEFVGIGCCSAQERFGEHYVASEETYRILEQEYEKASRFVEQYGGRVFHSYYDIVTSDEIDAIYIPLPPALHYEWAKKALDNGKHVLVEKPATTCFEDTEKLVRLAREKNRALHENYMFVYHKQLDEINQLIASGAVGDVRLYRVSFGFPRRDSKDFRYNKELGGGALLDVGGYTIKYATMLLGETAKIVSAKMNCIEEFDVDLYGSGMLCNKDGQTVQIAFGMDQEYKCDLEVWGSKGYLITGRVITAPSGFQPEVTIHKGKEVEIRKLSIDDSFKKSIQYFIDSINRSDVREKNFQSILTQTKLLDEFRKMAEFS